MNKTQQEHSLQDALEAFTKGLTVIKEAIGLVHSANDELPKGESQKAVQQKTEEAERLIQVGHAAVGQSLGFQLFHCTWPPSSDGHYRIRRKNPSRTIHLFPLRTNTVSLRSKQTRCHHERVWSL